MSEQTKSNWLINSLLAVILALLSGHYGNVISAAHAAGGGGWDTDGVMAMTSVNAQDCLILVDTKRMNIMLYKPQGTSSFKLVGARSYKYDIEIEDSDKQRERFSRGMTFRETKQMYDEAHAK